MIRATVIRPESNSFVVGFDSRFPSGRVDRLGLRVTVPVDGLSHARAVAAAFNTPHLAAGILALWNADVAARIEASENSPPVARYTVDGHDDETPDSTLSGDGEIAPFFLFDSERQEWLPTSYPTREAGNMAADRLNGKPRTDNSEYYQGRNARREGKELDSCPYTPRPEDPDSRAARWLAGWESGE